MKSRITPSLVGLLVLAGALNVRSQDVLISEIMYHPSSESPLEEYIELWNVAPTNVNVSGWRLTGGVEFTLPANTTIAAGRHLVIAANRARFQAKYPGVSPVVGDFAVVRVIDAWEIPGTNYVNILSNRRNRITLENAASNTVDSVTYADEGDWAIRQRGLPSPGPNSPNRGWTWYAPHDGLGRSLELVNPRMPNEYGQNWMASTNLQGTPGQTNSVFNTNIPPLVLDVIHAPLVPRSTDNVSVTARVLDERADSVTVALRYRVDSLSPGEFLSVPMLDDGQNNDGAANDGVYGARLGLLPHRTIIEFYVEARDAENNVRTWPAPAIDASDRGFAPLGQVANALFQVDDTTYNLTAPLYKLTLTAAETQELANMLAGNPQSDAQMNATFVSLDGEGTECRYLIGVRNRGHGSRTGNPHNYRVGFASDALWKGVSALNINARTVHAQHFGSTIALKSGAAGNYSRSIVLRINIDAAPGGTPNLGRYAANEVLDGDWAERHFPNDSEGNIYKVIRDIRPPNFNYRGTDPNQYRNTYFKESNVSEDDWADIIGMLAVMGENTTDTFIPENVYRVINVEQWLLHLAVMNLLGNNESGLNTGNNDDYYMYRGVNDPRFILMYHDLDQIVGQGGSLNPDADIFRATCCPISGDTEGSWRAMARFMRSPDYEPIYYRTLQRLLDTTFAETNFNALLDQTLGDYVSVNTINAMKSWMNQRRAYVQGVIAPFVTPVTPAPVATVSGAPRSPTPFTTATLTVGGAGITHYRFRLNNGALGPETPVATPIVLNNLAHGSSNIVRVIGRNAAGVWQAQNAFSFSRPWIVNTNWPAVRINEVLARNDGAVNHHGTFPDLIELFNEGAAALDLAGLRLSDDPTNPGKFVFPPNTVLPGGGYLVVYADNEDNTPGLHTGFALNGDGEGVYLFTAGGAGTPLDSVTFGPQVSNLSLGRHANGDWLLGSPTPGASNQVQALAAPTMLKINEWLAIGSASTPADFVELYNTAAAPVSLAGLFLTDQPIGAPRRHAVAPLSFIGARSALALLADGRPEEGPTHLNFGLAGEQGEIAVLDGAGNVIDCVIYGPQQRGVSMGRCPDGGIGLRSFALLTPGIGNVCPAAPSEPIVVNLIRITNAWKYEQTANLDGVPWKTREFNDAAWPSGPALLGVKVATHTLPEPVLTPLQVAPNRITFYFRHHFQVPAGASFTSLEFRHVVDDGAAFYLNGVEVGPRFNLASVPAPNPIPYSALAETTRAAAYEGPFPISAALLVPGDNVFAVEVHQNAANSADIIMGLTLDGVIVTNDPTAAGIVLNEVLANNATTTELDGRTPDWIELYNPSDAPVDLAGMALDDRLALSARRWFFPPGSIIPARGYRVVFADGGRPASPTNTGFGLSASGGSVFLFKKASDGGGLLDRIDYGLQTADYSIGRLPDGSGAWALTLPRAGTNNVAAPLGLVSGLRVNEWMADPASGDDWFEIYNTGDLPVALGGLYLSDDPGERDKFPIAPLSYIGSRSNAYQVFIADDPMTYQGPDHVNFGLSRNGDRILITAADAATQIDAVVFGAQRNGVSEGRLPDGDTNRVFFSLTPTRGAANYLPLTNVVINEALTHTDPPLEDAIELHNPTDVPVDISGWWLSDDRDQLQKFRIPTTTIIAAGGFKVFYEYQFNNSDLGIPFSLSSAKGDEIYLAASRTNGPPNGLRASVKFGPAANGVSFGRYRTSTGRIDFPAMSARSFGQDDPSSVEQFRTGLGAANPYPRVGPVVIRQIMYHPPDVVTPTETNDNVALEFIELRNLTSAPLPLYDPAHPTNGWRLRDAVDFVFNTAHSIPANGHLVVVSFDPQTNAPALAAFQAAYGSNAVLAGPYSGKLDNSSDSIELLRPDPPQTVGPDAGLVPYILVDKVVYEDRLPWPTNRVDGGGHALRRLNNAEYGNDPINWVGAAPALGASGASDSDGDGMPDDWEVLHGFNPNDPTDADQDADGDGVNNGDEYLGGTDPRDAAEYLHVVSVDVDGEMPRIRFQAVAGRTYTLQYRDTLGLGEWRRAADIPAQGVSGVVEVTDPTAAEDIQRFYRIVTPAMP